MSANLDFVRSIYADWDGGDFSHVEWAHPKIDYVSVDGPVPFAHHGLAEMGAASQTGSRGACLFHLREGKVTRLVLYWDRSHALAEFGLAPEGDAA